MARPVFLSLMVIGFAGAIACEGDGGGSPGGEGTAGAPEGNAGQPGDAGGTSGSGGSAVSAGAPTTEAMAGMPAGSDAGAGAGGVPSHAGGAPSGGDALDGCMTPTPGIVDYCEGEPTKKNALYCVSPSELPFADCVASDGHPLNFDGWCCDTAVCVRSTSLDAICGVLSPGKTAGFTCHADAEAPSADCTRTDDGACCPP